MAPAVPNVMRELQVVQSALVTELASLVPRPRHSSARRTSLTRASHSRPLRRQLQGTVREWEASQEAERERDTRAAAERETSELLDAAEQLERQARAGGEERAALVPRRRGVRFRGPVGPRMGPWGGCPRAPTLYAFCLGVSRACFSACRVLC